MASTSAVLRDDDVEEGYRWETGYEKTWETLKEDESGSLESSVMHFIHQAKRKRLAGRPTQVRLGVMRYLFLLVDVSQKMQQIDFKPTRLDAVCDSLIDFVDAFFEHNPMSQLGIVTTKDKRSERAIQLSANTRKLKDKIQSLKDTNCTGEPSLQNGLEKCFSDLKRLPAYSSREIVVVWGSITTVDPGNVEKSLVQLKNASIRVSVINLSAEITFFKQLATQTNGVHRVPLDPVHMNELLAEHTLPLPVPKNGETSLIKMGFPSHLSSAGPTTANSHMTSMCQCHQEEETNGQQPNNFTEMGYFCPQCHSKYCDLPVECQICGLVLVSAPHLARSYHHLFPLPPFNERTIIKNDVICVGCDYLITHKAYSCPSCDTEYCVDCDLFMHETLHTCIGCTNK